MTKEQINYIRDTMGFTAQELGERCGVTLKAAQHWLSGRRAPSGSAVVILTSLLAEAQAFESRKKKIRKPAENSV